MYWRMRVQQDYIFEKGKENKEFVRFLIHHAYHKIKLHLRYLKEGLLMQKIDGYIVVFCGLLVMILW
jgi:hypothetical protein